MRRGEHSAGGKQGLPSLHPRHDAEGRGQGVYQQQRQDADAGSDWREESGGGRADCRRPRGRPPAGPEALPALRGERAGLSENPLLRRYPQVPVGVRTPGAAGRSGPAGRHGDFCGHRREGRAKAVYQRPASPLRSGAEQKAPVRRHYWRTAEPAGGQRAAGRRGEGAGEAGGDEAAV